MEGRGGRNSFDAGRNQPERLLAAEELGADLPVRGRVDDPERAHPVVFRARPGVRLEGDRRRSGVRAGASEDGDIVGRVRSAARAGADQRFRVDAPRRSRQEGFAASLQKHGARASGDVRKVREGFPPGRQQDRRPELSFRRRMGGQQNRLAPAERTILPSSRPVREQGGVGRASFARPGGRPNRRRLSRIHGAHRREQGALPEDLADSEAGYRKDDSAHRKQKSGFEHRRKPCRVPRFRGGVPEKLRAGVLDGLVAGRYRGSAADHGVPVRELREGSRIISGRSGGPGRTDHCLPSGGKARNRALGHLRDEGLRNAGEEPRAPGRRVPLGRL